MPPTRVDHETTPRRCLRLVCPEDQVGGQVEQRWGLHLCEEHYRQFQDGTIGQGYNPRIKEWPVDELRDLILAYSDEHLDGSRNIRLLAKTFNTSKDTAFNILHGTYPTTRSSPAMAIIDAIAQREYERRHGLPLLSTLSPIQVDNLDDDEDEGFEGSEDYALKKGLAPSPGTPPRPCHAHRRAV